MRYVQLALKIQHMAAKINWQTPNLTVKSKTTTQLEIYSKQENFKKGKAKGGMMIKVLSNKDIYGVFFMYREVRGEERESSSTLGCEENNGESEIKKYYYYYYYF